MQDYEDYYEYEDDYYEEGEKESKGKKRFELILGAEEDASESGNGYWADDSPSVKDRQRRKKIR